MVRELGLKRRETVWSLSTVINNKNKKIFVLVRKDRIKKTYALIFTFYV